MDNTVSGLNNEPIQRQSAFKHERIIPRDLRAAEKKDVLELSAGKPATESEALNVVRERAFEQLRGIVDEARAELGIPEDATLDTSPEATADRIANFAIKFFDNYAENNGLEDDEEGRSQYAEFIGGAIEQGISEAREILQGLQVMSPEVNDTIENTAGLIQNRLDDFVANGL